MNKLKEIRLRHKKTQQDVADYLSVHRSTVTKWETGKHDPDKGNLLKLAAYYGVSTDELLGRDSTLHGNSETKHLSDLADDEIEIISKYRDLNPKGKWYIKKQFDFALSNDDLLKEKTISA